MLEQLKSLTWQDVLLTLFGFLGAVSPGFLTIFLYKPELIVSLETFKLLVFSLSITMPLVAMNMFVAWHSLPANEPKMASGVLGLFMSFLVFYPAIICAYVFHLSFKQLLLALVVVEVIVLLGAYMDNWRKPNKKLKDDAASGAL